MLLGSEPAAFSLRCGSAPRSPGLHVSSVLRSIALKIGVLKPDDEEEELDPLNEDLPRSAVNRMAAGLAWEAWYGPQVCDLYHPGEYCVDGLYLTPDGVSFDPFRVIEIKYTWRSSAKDVSQHWVWMTQLKVYCHCMDTRLGELHACYCMGDYRGGGPLPMVHRFEFQKNELEAVWRMILNEASRMRSQVRSQE
jgi:hypothetical protein